jgi:hypothetical protein
MRSFNFTLARFFQPEAVAAGEQATAETEPDLREATRLSEDGRWWWDGRRWVATSTSDGIWQWDGRRWRPTIEVDGLRARDLATTLAFLAENRYARAGAILAERAREWRPRGELADLVAAAVATRRRLLRVERAFGGGAGGPSGLLRRMRSRPEDRLRLEDEQSFLDTDYRALVVRLGRTAPRPTVKEADDLLEMARMQDYRAVRITRALTTANEIERARARAVVLARRDLQAVETARRDAMESATRALARVEEEREEERRRARARLRAAVDPPAGEALVQVGGLRVHAGFVDTPAGRLATAGLSAIAGSAVALWRQRRSLLHDVALLETAESEAFLCCLTERRRDRFLLLAGRSRIVLWHCPPGEEKPLRHLVTEVNRQAAAAAGPAAQRQQRAAEVLAQLTSREDRTSGPAASASRALAAAEADPELTRRLEAARRRLERAIADPPELVAARQTATSELRAVTTPPLPLTVASE